MESSVRSMAGTTTDNPGHMRPFHPFESVVILCNRRVDNAYLLSGHFNDSKTRETNGDQTHSHRPGSFHCLAAFWLGVDPTIEYSKHICRFHNHAINQFGFIRCSVRRFPQA